MIRLVEILFSVYEVPHGDAHWYRGLDLHFRRLFQLIDSFTVFDFSMIRKTLDSVLDRSRTQLRRTRGKIVARLSLIATYS